MREVRGQEDKVVDVTIPVQALVNAGKLNIPSGRGKVSLYRSVQPDLAILIPDFPFVVQSPRVLRKPFCTCFS